MGWKHLCAAAVIAGAGAAHAQDDTFNLIEKALKESGFNDVEVEEGNGAFEIGAFLGGVRHEIRMSHDQVEELIREGELAEDERDSEGDAESVLEATDDDSEGPAATPESPAVETTQDTEEAAQDVEEEYEGVEEKAEVAQEEREEAVEEREEEREEAVEERDEEREEAVEERDEEREEAVEEREESEEAGE